MRVQQLQPGLSLIQLRQRFLTTYPNPLTQRRDGTSWPRRADTYATAAH